MSNFAGILGQASDLLAEFRAGRERYTDRFIPAIASITRLAGNCSPEELANFDPGVIVGLSKVERPQVERLIETLRLCGTLRCAYNNGGLRSVGILGLNGDFGVGKSSIADILSSDGHLLVRENIEGNGALEDSVVEIGSKARKSEIIEKSRALAVSQVHFLVGAWDGIAKAAVHLADNGGGALVVDGPPSYQNDVRRLKLTDGLREEDFKVLNDLDDVFHKAFPPIQTKEVLLYCEPSVIERRIKERGREFEQNNPRYQSKMLDEQQRALLRRFGLTRISEESNLEDLASKVFEGSTHRVGILGYNLEILLINTTEMDLKEVSELVFKFAKGEIAHYPDRPRLFELKPVKGSERDSEP